MRELLLPFFLTLFFFPATMLLDATFSLQDLFVTKKPPLSLFLKMLLLKVPSFFVLAFPVSVMFGTILSLHRLARDQEILAFRMGGLSFYRILAPFLVLSILFSAASFELNEKIVPATNHASQNILRQLVLTQSVPMVQENILFQGNPGQHFYARRYDASTRTLQDVAVYELLKEPYPRAITAKQAKLFSNAWLLQNGVIHHFQKSGLLDYEAKFQELKVPVTLRFVEFLTEQRTPQEMTAAELHKQIEVFKKGGVQTKRLETDYYFKFSIPFACFIVTLLGAPLSVFFAKSGSFVGFGLCVVLVLVYYSLMAAGRELGFSGVLPPLLSAWLPNFFFGLAGGVLIYKVEH